MKKKLFDYSLENYNQDDTTAISNEAFSNTLYDLFTGGFTKSDIEETRKLTENIQKIESIKFDTNEIISIINEKKTVLEFYVKRNKLIRSFEDELNTQIKNIVSFREILQKIQFLLEEVPSNPTEFDLLDTINDANVMPLYKKVQSLAFLGSYSFYIENNKHFEKYSQRYNTNKDTKTIIQKKNPLLSFLGAWVFGGLEKYTAMTAYILAVQVVLKLSIFTSNVLSGGLLTYFLYKSTKDGVQAYKESKRWNKRYEALMSDAFEASAIAPSTFKMLSNKLHRETILLLDQIEEFDKFKEDYVNKNNKILKRILSNFKQITGVVIRALKSQGKYYRDIQTKDMRAF